MLLDCVVDEQARKFLFNNSIIGDWQFSGLLVSFFFLHGRTYPQLNKAEARKIISMISSDKRVGAFGASKLRY
jgi:hypothetical protein